MRLKVLVLLLTILIKSNCEGQPPNTSVPINDTICPLFSDYKLIYKDAKSFRFTDSLLKIAEAQLVELQIKINLLTAEQKEQKAFYESQMNYLRDQIRIITEQAAGFESLWIKSERQKKFWKDATKGLVVTVVVAAVKIFVLK